MKVEHQVGVSLLVILIFVIHGLFTFMFKIKYDMIEQVFITLFTLAFIGFIIIVYNVRKYVI